MISGIDVFLSGLRKPTLALLALVLVVLLGVVDVLTGPELSFSLFYLPPILALTWYAGKQAGVLGAAVAFLTWLGADYLSGHSYSHDLIPWWNGAIRLGFFLISLGLLNTIKNKLRDEERNADTDSLTGLANSRYFYELLQAESLRSARYRHPFTIAYIDLDGFKRINDTLGHAVGDEVLKEVANAIRGAIRRTDTVARLGGDEFIALFPETDFEAATAVIGNLRVRLAEAMEQGGRPTTTSIGAVTYPTPLESPADMVKTADELMYRVKKEGKNAVQHRLWGEKEVGAIAGSSYPGK